MKQASAILLILLLSFQWYGYRFVVNHFQQIADRNLETRLDAGNYTESELVEIRMPLNTPYQNNFTEFERCYGEVVMNGTVYTYVNRKIENNVLILHCIPNQGKQAIKSAGNDFFRDNNGLMDGQSQKKSTPLAKVYKHGFGDYENRSENDDLNISHQLRQETFVNVSSLCATNLPVAEQPPDTNS